MSGCGGHAAHSESSAEAALGPSPNAVDAGPQQSHVLVGLRVSDTDARGTFAAKPATLGDVPGDDYAAMICVCGYRHLGAAPRDSSTQPLVSGATFHFAQLADGRSEIICSTTMADQSVQLSVFTWTGTLLAF